MTESQATQLRNTLTLAHGCDTLRYALDQVMSIIACDEAGDEDGVLEAAVNLAGLDRPTILQMLEAARTIGNIRTDTGEQITFESVTN